MRTWEELEQACYNCYKCRLYEKRTNVVIGTGNKNADIMFIGEGPGEQEDLKAIPFVGAAGQLLNKMLKAIDLDRNDVYISNIVKCRPPYNRDPKIDEKEACLNYLRYQLLLIKPKIIVCLGRIAAQSIINPQFKITKEHGIWYEKKGYWIIATYHPSALLRDDTKKKPTYDDLKKLKEKYEEMRKEI